MAGATGRKESPSPDVGEGVGAVGSGCGCSRFGVEGR